MSTSEQTPNERSPTEQARTVRTRAAFLDHAERLFAEHGIGATSVTDVVEAADRSIGSLYHHFGNKDGLVAVVVERLLDELEGSVAQAVEPDRWHDATIRDIVTTYVRSSLSTSIGRPGYKRILVEASFDDAVVERRYRDARRRLDDGLVALLLERADEISHPDPEVGTRFVVDQLTSMLAARLENTTPTQLQGVDDDAFEREVVGAVVRHLGTAP